MKKTYSRPETELLDVEIDSILLGTSNTSASSTTPVLSKERDFDFDDDDDFEE